MEGGHSRDATLTGLISSLTPPPPPPVGAPHRGALRLLRSRALQPQVGELHGASPQRPLVPLGIDIDVLLDEVRGRLHAAVGEGARGREERLAGAAGRQRRVSHDLCDGRSGEVLLQPQHVYQLRCLARGPQQRAHVPRGRSNEALKRSVICKAEVATAEARNDIGARREQHRVPHHDRS